MCIAAYKPANITIPEETLRRMYSANPDGAGVMYAKAGTLYIVKGLMTAEAFIAAAQAIPAECPAVLHCRIASHGSVCPRLTHPFAVAKSVKEITPLYAEITSGYAVAHNGIIRDMHIGTDDISDTVAYVRDILYPLSRCGSLTTDRFRAIINKTIDYSRLAIMEPSGKTVLYGSGWIWDGGVAYSNSSYKPYKPMCRVYKYKDWDELDDSEINQYISSLYNK